MYDASLKRKWDAESLRQTAIIERERALWEGRQEGRAEGREEGRQEGRAEGLELGLAKAKAEKNETARKMLASGFALPVISDLLGLSIKEIEALKSDEK